MITNISKIIIHIINNRHQKESVEVHVHLNQGQQDQGQGRGSRRGKGNKGGRGGNRRRAIPEEVDGGKCQKL